jgi:SNF family Na+-dependent transporter
LTPARQSSGQIAGWVGMAGGVMILCFYSVVAGWVAAFRLGNDPGQFRRGHPQKKPGRLRLS